MFPRTALLWLGLATSALAQQVCLPAPRLLTLTPLGAQVGTTVEVTLKGDNLEDVSALLFSSPQLTAQPVAGAENRFTVTIAPDAPAGVYDARVLSRLGVSSARAFSVGHLPEAVRAKPNTSLATAWPLALNSICDAATTKRAVDYYSFQAKQGQPLAIECAAVGIDSRLTPVTVVADAQGRDLVVNRTGGPLTFTPPADGLYHVKVSDLTYQGGERHFYRLALQSAPAAPLPQTATVSSMSWPPAGLPATAAMAEAEPNHEQPQPLALPCDVSGSFFPAADVDTYEFTAKKGEVWWVEVGSERLRLDTDPFVLVQRVLPGGAFADVAELADIPSPIKVSTFGYSYDGPPYNVGSPDVNGKFTVPEDGTYRLQLRDLFGGTRSDPGNLYRLIVRRAAPDFALAAWAVHLTLRNGDRAALSKPLALRAGASMALEVVAQRRDGFDGEIQLSMENLPPGVTAAGLKIPAGKSVGHLILTAAEDAPRGFSLASITGRATIGGVEVLRAGRLASMEWPVPDIKGEVPSPRLMADVPVSVTDSEYAPLSISAADPKVWHAAAGATLKIPLKFTWRDGFSGTSLKLQAYGPGLSGMKDLEIPLKAATGEAVLDLAALKVPPGEYTLALVGSAVSAYRYNPAAVPQAEAEQKRAAEAKAAAEAAMKLAATDAEAAKAAAEKQKLADAAMASATKRMQAASAMAAPRDTVDIFVSEPIRIVVQPGAPK